MAGNSVILKHASADAAGGRAICRGAQGGGAARRAVPKSGAQPCRYRKTHRFGRASITSTSPGRSRADERIERAAAGTFATLGLELGGKDPAYVREDANLSYAVENLVDGSFFNSGQSCCGVGAGSMYRPAVYDRFVENFVEILQEAGRSAARSIRRRWWGRWQRRGFRRPGARTDAGSVAQGRQGASQHAARTRRGELAISRPRGAYQRQSPDGSDARREFRAGGRHHEGGRRRGGHHA